MFASLDREELTELCAKMGRALHASHAASTEPGSLEIRGERRDVHAELMALQPALWSACRALTDTTPRTSGAAAASEGCLRN